MKKTLISVLAIAMLVGQANIVKAERSSEQQRRDRENKSLSDKTRKLAEKTYNEQVKEPLNNPNLGVNKFGKRVNDAGTRTWDKMFGKKEAKAGN